MDPLGFAAGQTNKYKYLGNSPPNVVDPSGLKTALLTLDYNTKVSITTKSGNNYSLVAPTYQQFVETLQAIKSKGDTISVLEIRGHGNESGVILSGSESDDNLNVLTAVSNDGVANVGVGVNGNAESITDLLNSITDSDSEINLISCNSNGFAAAFSQAVPNATVYGIGRNYFFGTLRSRTGYKGGQKQ